MEVNDFSSATMYGNTDSECQEPQKALIFEFWKPIQRALQGDWTSLWSG